MKFLKFCKNQRKNVEHFSLSLNGGLIIRVSLTEKDLVDQEVHGHQLWSKPSKPESEELPTRPTKISSKNGCFQKYPQKYAKKLP
jgi:hypothetical protein